MVNKYQKHKEAHKDTKIFLKKKKTKGEKKLE